MAISGKTKLVGLLGWPVSHTFSPAMHNAAAHSAEIDLVYLGLPLAPSQVAEGISGLAALGFIGVNVTLPHKQAVMPYLDQMSEAAQVIGAVNTIMIEREASDGQVTTHLLGDNTDWTGFLGDLDALNVALEGRDCLVLGAGGSARAVVYGLLKRGANVKLLARRLEQAEQLVASFDPFIRANKMTPPTTHLLSELAQLETSAPLIVNTTPLGMTPKVEMSPWPHDLPFPVGAFVYDLVYTPSNTKLMRQAQAAGCDASNGLGMLLRQGATAFELWTGVAPDLDVMRVALGF
ncbi:MAG: shikimate dehydrogenase [Candidatus Promineifilaceae bacterium]